ncbi:MAG: GldG family protein [Ruminococcus sp.]|jgi:hypothetical protein|nr:GldG family protein [Ruminococcus sp.]
MSEDIKKDPVSDGKPDKKKRNLKKLKYGTMSVILAIIVIAVIVILNVIVTLASERVNLSADLTSNNIYALSAETTDFIKTVNANVEIVVMLDENTINASGEPYYKQALEIIKKYPQENSRISVDFINLTVNPQYTARYANIYQGSIAVGDIVITSGGRIRTFAFDEMFNVDYSTGQARIGSSKAEQMLTSAILYVCNANPKKVYIMQVESAEAYPTTGNILKLLSDNGYDVLEWNPALETLPEDADVLVVDAPLNDFTPETISSIYSFLENDGKYSKNLIYLANASQKEMTNMNSLLSDWGMRVKSGYYITDKNVANLIRPETPFFISARIDTSNNNYIEGVTNPELPVIISYASPIELLGTEITGTSAATKLLSTSDTSYAVNDELFAQLSVDPNTPVETASYPVMALSSKGLRNDDGLEFSNVLVISGSEMLDETLSLAGYYNNGEYFVSIVNTMTGRSDNISLIPKSSREITFPMDMSKYNSLSALFMYIIPIGVAIVGAIVLIRRRNK